MSKIHFSTVKLKYMLRKKEESCQYHSMDLTSQHITCWWLAYKCSQKTKIWHHIAKTLFIVKIAKDTCITWVLRLKLASQPYPSITRWHISIIAMYIVIQMKKLKPKKPQDYLTTNMLQSMKIMNHNGQGRHVNVSYLRLLQIYLIKLQK